MAEAPAAGGGPMAAITRKVGPLPLWAWAAILVVGFVLYRRMKGGSSSPTAVSSSPGDTAQTDQNTYVPGFDAAGAGGGGGIGATGVPSTVNNYYYGDQAAVQANGGGTAPNPNVGGGTQAGGGQMTPGGQRGSDPGPISAGSVGIHYFGPGGSGVYYPPAPSGATSTGFGAVTAPGAYVPAGVTVTPGKFTAV